MNPKEKIVLGFLISVLGIGVTISFYNRSKAQKELRVISQPLRVELPEKTLVNINTATEDELISLPGIGRVTAQKIIQYRTTYGSFKKKRELLKIKGIGKKKFQILKDKITTGD